MAEQDDEDLLFDFKIRAMVLYDKKRDWGLRPELPDPTYNPKNGWTLDQFAMRFEPELLREHKQFIIDKHRPLETPSAYPPHFYLGEGAELSEKVKSRLLDPRYRVEALRPGSYDPEVVPRLLLESMTPYIVLSELIEGTYARPRRHFEKVRVFDQSAEKKTTGGRKPTYDWPALKKHLERDSPDIFNDKQLVEYCQTNVRAMPGKRAAKDGPDVKTVEEAIAKYGLKKFIKSK
jgi:hypothetical protein